MTTGMCSQINSLGELKVTILSPNEFSFTETISYYSSPGKVMFL